MIRKKYSPTFMQLSGNTGMDDSLFHNILPMINKNTIWNKKPYITPQLF